MTYQATTTSTMIPAHHFLESPRAPSFLQFHSFPSGQEKASYRYSAATFSGFVGLSLMPHLHTATHASAACSSICIFDPCTPLGPRRFGCAACRMIMGAGRSPAHIMRLLLFSNYPWPYTISQLVSSFLTESQKLTYILTHDDTNTGGKFKVVACLGLGWASSQSRQGT